MIGLRALGPDDAERLFRWRRDPDVDRWMTDVAPAEPGPYGEWIGRLRQGPDHRGWMITLKGEPCGLVTLTDLEGPHRRGQWGWFVGDAAARGHGVGRAAQALGLDLAFSELGLEKVWSETLARNEAALKAQAAAGFRREGYLRSHVVKEGRREDVVVMGVLAQEWAAERQRVLKGLTEAGLLARANQGA